MTPPLLPAEGFRTGAFRPLAHPHPPPLIPRPAAFPFFYINPSDKQFAPLIEKLNDAKKPISAFDPVGNSPVIIHKDQMKVRFSRKLLGLSMPPALGARLPRTALCRHRLCFPVPRRNSPGRGTIWQCG